MLALDSSAVYRICVQGTLGQNCRDHLQVTTLEYEHDEGGQSVTILTSQLPDQAALIGALSTLYNFYHLPLLSVECVSIGGK